MPRAVFISYSSHDKATAEAVCTLLEARGLPCWIAPRDILPGAAWAESIIEALDAAEVMVLIFTANANASPQIQREVERAVNKGVSIVPLRIEDAKPSKTMEYFISASHYLDAFHPPLESHIERLAEAVRALLARNTPTAPAVEVRTRSDAVPPRGSEPPFGRTQARLTAPQPTSASARAWRRRTVVAAAALVLVAAGGYTLWATLLRPGLSAGERVMLAVMPFRNVGGQAEQEYFTDGLTDETITQLVQLRPDRLGVIALTSSMAYKQSGKTIGEIGSELAVDYVLQSGVGYDDRRVRVTSQLVRVSDQATVWADRYERDFDSVFAIQNEVARDIGRALTLELLPDQVAKLERTEDVAPEAYQAFLKGRFFWSRRTQADIRTGLAFFQQALAAAPDYARAHAGLSDSYNMLARYDSSKSVETFPHAKEAALEALRLAPDLAEAHTSLAYVLLHYDRDWKGAEREFTRAIELNPGYATAHQWYARLLTAMGRHEESLAEIRLAQRLDPLSPIVNAAVGYSLYFARQYDEAIQQGRKTLELDPEFSRAHFNLGIAYLEKGSGNEALAELGAAVKGAPTTAEYLATLGYAHARLGRRQEARSILARLPEVSPDGYVSPYLLALVHLSLGESDEAIAWLEKAVTEREQRLVNLQVEPAWDPLRRDPRFEDLLQRVGLRP